LGSKLIEVKKTSGMTSKVSQSGSHSMAILNEKLKKNTLNMLRKQKKKAAVKFIIHFLNSQKSG
jgi:hypothetical protein